jgi:hypothetical protein
MVHVTQHAVDRALERVPGLKSEAQAYCLLTSWAVHKAIEIGAPFVRLGTGQRIVLMEDRVITVLPRGTWMGCLCTDATRKHEFH